MEHIWDMKFKINKFYLYLFAFDTETHILKGKLTWLSFKHVFPKQLR